MSKPSIILCGPKEFIEACRRAANIYNVVVAGEVFNHEELYTIIDKLKPDGILAPSEWKEIVFNICNLRPNIRGYLSGGITVNAWQEIQELPYRNVMTVKNKPEDAVRTVAESLKRLSPTGFKFDDRMDDGIRPTVISPKVVDVVEKFIVPVYSTKGGVGKTTVATNAAAILGMWSKSIEEKCGRNLRTILLDFNTDYGTAMTTLGYTNLEADQMLKIKTVAHWSQISTNAGWDNIVECLNYHERSNIYYLAPPQEFQERMAFTAELAERIMFLVKKYFHFVFIDLGVALDKRDPAVIALDNATQILFMLDLKYDTVCKAIEFCKYEMPKLFGDFSKISLVVNRSRPTWFNVKDILNLFDEKVGYVYPLRAQLPEDKNMEKYDGKGAPYVCYKPDSPFSEEMSSLCKSLLGAKTLQLLPDKKIKVKKLFSLIPWKGRDKNVAL